MRFALRARLFAVVSVLSVTSLAACGGDDLVDATSSSGGGGAPSTSASSDSGASTVSSSSSATTASSSSDGGGGVGGAGGAGGDASTTSTSSASQGGGTGGGGVPEGWSTDPCDTLTPTIKNPTGKTSDGRDMFDGTQGKDVIFGTDGPDLIRGLGGDDVICGGGGEDEIYGGDGDDYIDGGRGNDVLEGNGGHDLMHGRAGSDWMRGGAGNDYIAGDILDDRMWGEDGNDVLIGGHGVDAMHGGEGDDWLRGDTNGDEFVGGNGQDTASFATATPPGQPLGTEFEGVTVDLNLIGMAKLEVFGENAPEEPCGFVSGDGANEPIVGIETVIGSPFRDKIIGNGKAKIFGGYGDDVIQTKAGDVAEGGPGNDTCNGAACDDANEAPSPTGLFAYVGVNERDPGLFVLGTDGPDAVTIETRPAGILLTSTNGQPFQVGTYCAPFAAGDLTQVLCKLPGTLAFMLGWGGQGEDVFTFGDGFGREFTAHVDGGPDTNKLTGGAGAEVFFAGRTGADELRGNGGDDALITEGLESDPAPEGDLLDGGTGDDQLVADDPCDGHVYVGGPGLDIAGFARAGTKHRIFAQLGGPCAPANRQEFYGKAYDPGLCAGNKALWTTLGGDLEVLEGADLADQLHGNDDNNILWGREGNDVLHGWGGDDVLEGLKGNDFIWGDEGADVLLGQSGDDTLHAKDGTKDRVINCSGGTLADADAIDPPAQSCQ